MLVGGYGATVYPTVAWSSINRPPPLLCRRDQRTEDIGERGERRREGIDYTDRVRREQREDDLYPSCEVDPDSIRIPLYRPGLDPDTTL